MSLNKPLDQVTRADFEDLLLDPVSERKTIDYKRALNIDTPQAKDEFRRDVSSFANASGGDLVYGIDDKGSGIPVAISGFTIPSEEKIKLQLSQVLESHVRPRIPGVDIQPIPLGNDEYATVVRIPRSYAMPHQVTVNGDHLEFWARNAAGKYRLDVDELRSIILRSETLAARIRSFRLERLARIVSNEIPMFVHGGKIVLHLVPLGAFDPNSRIDLTCFDQRANLGRLRPIYDGITHYHYNLEGFVTKHLQHTTHELFSYAQMFRNGCIESADGFLLREDRGTATLPAHRYEGYIREVLPLYLDLMYDLGIVPPIAVMLSFTGVRGHVIESGCHNGLEPVDREDLILEERLIEDFSCSIDAVLKPIFDVAWNACGLAGSPNYDVDGQWAG